MDNNKPSSHTTHRCCSFCGDPEVILTSGYRYCKKCLRKKDASLIESWASELIRANGNLKDILTELFQTEDYCLNAFKNLYDQWDRGPWNPSSGFDVPQQLYLQKCLKDFLSKRKNRDGKTSKP